MRCSPTFTVLAAAALSALAFAQSAHVASARCWAERRAVHIADGACLIRGAFGWWPSP
jgi:hypothetical protein